MDVKEIVMEPKRINKLLDAREENKYLQQMYVTPAAFKRYSQQDQDRVREKVTQLPSDELVIIYLTFWEGLCEYEIAKSIRSTANKVSQIKSRALLHLKEMIELDKQKKEQLIA
jgi:DNA-directed RNA polymerase specialized sigma24 family protein